MGKKPYAIFDLETTSLNIEEARILELGLIVVDGNQSSFIESKLIQYNDVIPDVVTQVTGITKAMTTSEDAQPLSEVLDWMYGKIGDRIPIIGHNIIRYDVPILQAECQRISHKMGHVLFDARLSDTAALFKAWKLNILPRDNENHQDFCRRVMDIRIRGLKFNLQHCIIEMGIKTDIGPAHRASADVEMTWMVFEALMDKGPEAVAMLAELLNDN